MLWQVGATAQQPAGDDFTDAELAVIERYLRRITDVGSEQTARMREG
jgi:hypothetical protein